MSSTSHIGCLRKEKMFKGLTFRLPIVDKGYKTEPLLFSITWTRPINSIVQIGVHYIWSFFCNLQIHFFGTKILLHICCQSRKYILYCSSKNIQTWYIDIAMLPTHSSFSIWYLYYTFKCISYDPITALLIASINAF